MPAFDLRTILLMSAVMPGLVALVMSSMRRNFPRNIRGVGLWALGALLESLAVIVLSLRGSVPDWLSIIAGNVFLIGGIGIWLAGSQRFYGLRPSWRLIALLLVIDASGLAIMTWIYPTGAGRSLCSNVILAYLYGRHAHVMLGFGRKDKHALFVGAMFLIQTIVTVMRIWTSLQASKSAGGLLATDLMQKIYLGCGAFMGLAVTVGFMLVAMNRLRIEFEKQSLVDPLTGLLNRRAFVREHADALQIASRKGGFLSLLLIDIDHFKHVNDTYGHSIGDDVLVDFATRAAAVLPHGAQLARWGGEEFAALLPGYVLHDALVLADSVRLQVSSQTNTELPDYTCSIGVASLQGEAASIKELVRRADGALYRAKHGGRNRVSPAEEMAIASAVASFS
ncbi:diguanylate cyclase [Caballeronia hypogeia]|uniref:diguanylate cyclase n=1 Tax=Caballeronia hypogeia TaxID=1777140 RepID=A0A158A1M6_9BURK|nr:GGDEF domain-containing protein [Caballeronia hypogeia]SAK51732.1 diguanylate cyclase [Caballeronia hypogeia]